MHIFFQYAKGKGIYFSNIGGRRITIDSLTTIGVRGDWMATISLFPSIFSCLFHYFFVSLMERDYVAPFPLRPG